jgi:hypothetical protein
VLTEVKAYSSLQAAPSLLLAPNGRAENDFIQIRNIDGLDPVIASVGTTPYGSSDGEAYVGSSVLSRNLVLTLHPNPDWDTWSPEALRRLLYSYFMPKQAVRLLFMSDDMQDVDIRGVVESFAANPFSKDPEYIASVICPDPYFSATTAVVLTGNANDPDIDIDYGGSIPGGIQIEVDWSSGTNPTLISIDVGNPDISTFEVSTPNIVSANNYFRMSSFPRSKYVENVYTSGANKGKIISLLSNVTIAEGSTWPMLQPGSNSFSLGTDHGVQAWQLTYLEKFGGL